MANGIMDGMPGVVAVATAPNYGRFAIGPVEAGLGMPLGNALRRILLSSLPGSAVTSIRIQNVYHEFSCIPNVREDVTEIVLNVKNIRLRSYSDRAVRLNLSKRGPGVVRASDIELPANVELVNPELELASLDGPDSTLEMELTVERGRGYVSFEAREGVPIGTIPVDAVFSPIPRVNYIVQPADAEVLSGTQEGEGEEVTAEEVEGREQVLIEIWTDGTIDPGEALSMSAQYLAQHSSLIAGFNRVTAPTQVRETQGIPIPAHLFEMSIEDLNLSMRTYNCLKRSGITKVGQVLRMDKKELLGLRNFGEKSFEELYQSLSSRDLIPPGTPLDIPAEEALAGEGEGDGEDVEDADIDYPNFDMEEPDPSAFIGQDGSANTGVSRQVVNLAGESEGSAEASAGIYIDDEPASQAMNLTGDTVPQSDLMTGDVPDEDDDEANEAGEAQTKTRARKSK